LNRGKHGVKKLQPNDTVRDMPAKPNAGKVQEESVHVVHYEEGQRVEHDIEVDETGPAC
jgi:hypothetical protein